jgi:hypothetical protein
MTEDLWRRLVAAESKAKRNKVGLWDVQSPTLSSTGPFMLGFVIGMMFCVFLILWWAGRFL